MAAACGGGGTEPGESASATSTPGATASGSPTPAPGDGAADDGLDDGVDLILHNGAVHTLDDAGVVSGVAVDDDRIVAVGSDTDVLALAGERTAIVDLAGRAVYPGFIDAHSHWFAWGGPWLGIDSPEQVSEMLVSRGWTGTTEMAIDDLFIDGLVSALEDGKVTPRVRIYLNVNVPSPTETIQKLDWFDDWGLTPGQRVGERGRIDGIKFFLESGWSTQIHWTPEELLAAVTGYHEDGWRIAAHSIGDDTLDVLLDAFESIGDPAAVAQRRHRVEHMLEARDDQLARVAELGLTASVQFGAIEADFALEDGFAESVADSGLGAVWRWQDILDAGIPLVGSMDIGPPGYDLQATSLSPMRMIYGAVTGRSESGVEPWPGREEQLLTVDQAVAALTVDAAWIAGDEAERGSIAVGKLADLTILSEGFPSDSEIDRILDIAVDATVIGGELVWCGEGQDSWCSAFGQPIPPRTLDEASLVAAPPGGGQADGPETDDDPAAVPVEGSIVAAVTASTIDPDFPAAGAVDGDAENGGWLSGEVPAWIELDLGEPTAVSALRLWVDAVEVGPSVHVVAAGDVPGPDTEVAVLDGETGWGQMLEVPIDATVRYIRVETLESAVPFGWLEIEVVPG